MTGNESSVKCQANKTWSQGSECRPVKCFAFELPQNSTSNDKLADRTLGESVSYTCIEGFELNGNESTVKCLGNRTWTKGSECVRVKCPEFILPPNTTSNESRINRTFGDVILYTCQVGFEMTGNESTVKCQANKTWSQESECRPVKCIAFQLPPNTTSNDKLTDRTLRDSISYTCIEGFELNGNESTVKCQANKAWTKGSECKPVMCPEFNFPPNTTSIESRVNKTFGDVISYTCQVGFELTGNQSSVKCQANKTWTKGSECQIVRCPEFPLPSNSIFNGSRVNRTFGEVIAYNCQSGYEMAGNDSSVVCQANKTWSRGSDCLPVRCIDASLPSYSTSNASLTNMAYGATITYSCQAGYELNGNISSIVCQANRTWTNGSSCEIVLCQIFKPPNNSVPVTRVTEYFTYGTNISVSCIEGYEGGGYTDMFSK